MCLYALDLEEMKDDLDEEEYEATKSETLDQMKEFQTSLNNMLEGNITLVSEMGSVQLAIQAAIQSQFKSEEVKSSFTKKESEGLRRKLGTLDSDYKLGRLKEDFYYSQAGDILTKLENLGETLTEAEKDVMSKVECTIQFFCLKLSLRQP